MKVLARLALLSCCVVLALAAGGCASRQRLPASIVTLAVMDGTMATGREETRRSESGWWFGAQTRYDSGTAGVILGDALAEEFARIPGLQVMSRTDLRSYMAQKERLVYRQWPDLSAEERLKILQRQNPVDYGRSLNVDYVLTSRVYECRLIHHHFPHTWTARGDFAVDLWDVRTGAPVWTWQGRESDMFSSTTAVLERLARRAGSKARRADPFNLFPGVPGS